MAFVGSCVLRVNFDKYLGNKPSNDIAYAIRGNDNILPFNVPNIEMMIAKLKARPPKSPNAALATANVALFCNATTFSAGKAW